MAEVYQRFRQFDYRMSSNLVLQREAPAPNQNEPTGEPESLAGRLDGHMGDRVMCEIPRDLKARADQKRRQGDDVDVERTKRARVSGPRSVLEIADVAYYTPTTTQTRRAYEQLLNSMQGIIGDQTEEILIGAANEILEACKTDDATDTDRKHMCEELIGCLSEEQFTSILRIAERVVDFGSHRPHGVSEGGEDAEVASSTIGVAVVFDEEDEKPVEEFDDALGPAPEDDEEADDREDAERRFLETKHLAEDDGEEVAADDQQYGLEVSKIDPHWLQRELGNIFLDRQVAVATEKEILSILPKPDVQECENDLVYVLKYDNFKFAKLILKNRWKIFYCTRLGQAQSEQEKNTIREEMQQSPEGEEVLELLNTVSLRRNKEREFALNVRKEAARLQTGPQRRRGLGEPDTEEVIVRPLETEEVEDLEECIIPPSRIFDLQNLAFTQGGHLMTNERVKLPEGSQRVEFKTHDEVIIPPYKAPAEQVTNRKPLSDLPEWTRAAFDPSVQTLNCIQTTVCDCAFNNHTRNMLVCAPTGSGKTNIALLAMLNVIGQHRRDDGSIDRSAFKIIYISPMKALVAEQVAAFSKRLECFGIQVSELTGDINLTRTQIDATQVIVATPEKWDVITRKAGERTYTQVVKLVILDEVHLLHDSRGPVLESIVARTLRQIESTQEYVRLVGLSATLPNAEDVAMFMRVPMDIENRSLFIFGNQYRPVPLQQTYIGVKEKKAIKRYHAMNQITYEKVLQSAGKDQVLIFVHSRKETTKTAKMLRDMAMQNETLPQFLGDDIASREILSREAESARTADLKDLLPFGFAIHHAGLPRRDRELVESLFADRHVPVLVSTATLAWGVNLPAHTVIIKGTQIYSPDHGKWVELSPMDIMQMMGRAGRPQFDTSGEAFILTNHAELQYYLSLNNQQLPIESQLIGSLPDIINAEVVLGTIRSRDDAFKWFGYTYLFVRLLRRPSTYDVTDDEVEQDKTLAQRRMDLIHSALCLLDKHRLIQYDRRTGTIQVTALGRVASHYYLKHPTLAVLNEQLRPSLSTIELLRLFSLSSEFKNIPVREAEQVELSKLIERVPLPVKGASDEPSAKISVLLQAYISKLKLEGFALMADMTYVTQNAGRILRAVFEIALKRGWGSLALKALDLYKNVDRCMWNSMSPLRQFADVPHELIRKLERRDFPWDRYYDLTSTELGELIRMPKMGKSLHVLIHKFPKLEISAYVQPATRACLLVEVTIGADFRWDRAIHGSLEPFWLFVLDSDGETILHHEMFVIKEENMTTDLVLNFAVPISEMQPPHYFIRVVSDRWIGAGTSLPVTFKHLILPEKTPPHTELLDLQPGPISSLRFPEAEAIYSAQFSVFNPMQTQSFHALYESDDNVLLCAPPASGQIVCAELAILRMLKTESIRRCVYVAPNERILEQRLQRWRSSFGKLLGLVVNELSGDIATDVKILTESNIVVSTPETWDFVSRRWRTRKVVQQIRLFICDELHVLGSSVQSGAAMEVCVSRMRYISAQLPHKVRLVGLSASVANAADLGEWLGAGPASRFNFHPNIRVVPLEILLHAFDTYHRPSRLLAMTKPMYQAIKGHSPTKPIIIFCPDRKQARLTVIELIRNAAAENRPKRFLRGTEGQMLEILGRRSMDVDQGTELRPPVGREKALEQAMLHGVGLLHEGSPKSDQRIVEKAFEAGLLQVLVCTESLVWGLTVNSHLVVIQDTKKFDGKERRWVDYAVSDVLRMLACATRPGIDANGVALLMCHSSKKDFYRRFIFEPIPVESQLEQRLADHVCAEVVLKTITTTQDAVDWLTWTYYYRRLSKNPNFYGLQGVTDMHISEHLSEVVENSIEALEQSQCLSSSSDNNNNDGHHSLIPLNLGLISAFYYLRYTTIELFNRSITASISRKGILEIVCAASEFDDVPIRTGESKALRRLASTCGMKISKETDLESPNIKALILISAHFARAPLTTDFASDQTILLERLLRLLQGMVDVISSNGWLRPALCAMELSQMTIQSMTASKSPLFQLPHLTQEIISKCQTDHSVEDVVDFCNMDDDDRTNILQHLSSSQIADIANACNRYPIISVSHEVRRGDATTMTTDTKHGESIDVIVTLERDMTDEIMGPVYASYYPKEKSEQWWLVLGHVKTNALLAIKRIAINKPSLNVRLSFEVPSAGLDSVDLFLLPDCYLGCDQEYGVALV